MALLNPGDYEYIVDTNEWLILRSDAAILNGLQQSLGAQYQVLDVERPFFSSNIVVSLKTLQPIEEIEFLRALLFAFRTMYPASAFVAYRGGLEDVWQNVTQAAGQGIGNILRPIIPIGLLIGGILLLLRKE